MLTNIEFPKIPVNMMGIRPILGTYPYHEIKNR